MKKNGFVFTISLILTITLCCFLIGIAHADDKVSGQAIVDYARQFIGVTPYKNWGRSLTTGADCSGFVCAIYEHFGIDLWQNRAGLINFGKEPYGVSLDSAVKQLKDNRDVSGFQPGDILIFHFWENGKDWGHVGIYSGNGYMIHCAANYWLHRIGSDNPVFLYNTIETPLTTYKTGSEYYTTDHALSADSFRKGLIGAVRLNRVTNHTHDYDDVGHCKIDGCNQVFDWIATAGDYATKCGVYKATCNAQTSKIPYYDGEDAGELVKGKEYNVVSVVRNHYTNYEHIWYGIDDNGDNIADRWEWNERMTKVRDLPIAIYFENVANPPNQKQGGSFPVTGMVRSAYNISKISVFFVEALTFKMINKPELATITYGNTNTVDLSGKVDEAAWFASLDPGQYRMGLTAENVKGEKKTYYTQQFTVSSNTPNMGSFMLIGCSEITDWDSPWESLRTPDGTIMGTCDVYINGRRYADDVSQLSGDWPIGTTYEISDIRGMNGYQIDWDRCENLSGTIGSFSYSRISFKYHEPAYYNLDITGQCDGINTASTEGFMTFDVYINDKLAADNVTCYHALLEEGTEFFLWDFRTKNGKQFEDSVDGTLSGFLQDNTSIVLRCSTLMGTLHLDCYMGGEIRDELLGTVNVYIDHVKVASNVRNFEGEYPLGTYYRIELVEMDAGRTYNGVLFANEPYCGGLTGLIESEDYYVYMSMTNGPEWFDWAYADTLPEHVTPDIYDIWYKNYYTTVSSSSPGDGWVEDDWVSGKYEPVGNPYESDIELPTSDERRLIAYSYYHCCGASMGKYAEHYMTGGYVHFDSITDVNSVVEASVHQDDTMPEYKYYVLKWKDGSYAYCQSGVTCDGSNGTHGKRSYYWYKHCKYQDYQWVDYYNYIKESDWVREPDPNAAYTTVCYKMIFQPVERLEFVPDIIEVNLSDKYVKVNYIAEPDRCLDGNLLWVGGPCAGIEDGLVTLSDVGVGYVGCQALNNDWSGPDATLTLIVHSDHKLIIPEGVKVIEAEAFAGDTSIEEVVLPQSLEKIESRAFANCTNLKMMYFPERLSDLAKDAFSGCGYFTMLCTKNSVLAQRSDAGVEGWCYPYEDISRLQQ